jgi:hypothetical protein
VWENVASPPVVIRHSARDGEEVGEVSRSKDHDNNSYRNNTGDEKNQQSKGVKIQREKMRAGQPDEPVASRVCFIAYDSR